VNKSSKTGLVGVGEPGQEGNGGRRRAAQCWSVVRKLDGGRNFERVYVKFFLITLEQVNFG
jgi:hypothetical protein